MTRPNHAQNHALGLDSHPYWGGGGAQCGGSSGRVASNVAASQWRKPLWRQRQGGRGARATHLVQQRVSRHTHPQPAAPLDDFLPDSGGSAVSGGGRPAVVGFRRYHPTTVSQYLSYATADMITGTTWKCINILHCMECSGLHPALGGGGHPTWWQAV